MSQICIIQVILTVDNCYEHVANHVTSPLLPLSQKLTLMVVCPREVFFVLSKHLQKKNKVIIVLIMLMVLCA